MKFNLFSSPATPRCSFTKSHGHRCRMLPLAGSPFCFSHQPAPPPDELLAAELLQAASSLSAPEDINRVLIKIFQAVIQDRLSLKKARALNTLAINILRSFREIAFHQQRKEDSEKEHCNYLGYDIPRPHRAG